MGIAMDKMIVEAMSMLEEESGLLEIVRLVGAEALSAKDRLSLETSRSIREDYLHQNAFHKVDTFTTLEKQFEILKTILYFHKKALASIEAGVDTADISKLTVREEIARAKYIPQEEMDKIAKIRDKIDEQMKKLQTVGAA
ncbi:MAG: hypothetical protein E4H40_09135 [Candidatus Brocadiia bacterium]|nr:MAG: hypothetical protein E4H40_09135 [Candidatus Brocadiia bacterium]